MNVAKILKRRKKDWSELDALTAQFQSRRKSRLEPKELMRFAALYRSACADLALAQAYRLPEATIQFLHQLIARAHNVLYRSDRFRISTWARTLYVDIPRRILRDPCVWIALGLFWGLFLGTMTAAVVRPAFAHEVVGAVHLAELESMYAEPLSGRQREAGERSFMAGFYVWNNAGIGLQCFSAGIFLGIGSLVVMGQNALVLGTSFGFMARSEHAANFFEFVTAHGPLELTAIAFSAAAGLRMGWSIVDTGGYSRMESLRRQAPQSLELAVLAVVMFCLAAFVEAYISPSPLSYSFKAGVAIVTAMLIVAYVFVLGWRRPSEATNAT